MLIADMGIIEKMFYDENLDVKQDTLVAIDNPGEPENEPKAIEFGHITAPSLFLLCALAFSSLMFLAETFMGK